MLSVQWRLDSHCFVARNCLVLIFLLGQTLGVTQPLTASPLLPSCSSVCFVTTGSCRFAVGTKTEYLQVCVKAT